MFRTPSPRFFAAAAVATLAVASLAGCALKADPASWSGATSECAHGVQVVVDYGILAHAPVSKCVPEVGDNGAKKVLSDAGLTTAGTDKYPDLALCRLGGLPSASASFQLDGKAYTEPCKDFPPMNAYWAIWTKDAGQQWKMAEVGINDVHLVPGSSIALLFGDGSKTPA